VISTVVSIRVRCFFLIGTTCMATVYWTMMYNFRIRHLWKMRMNEYVDTVYLIYVSFQLSMLWQVPRILGGVAMPDACMLNA